MESRELNKLPKGMRPFLPRIAFMIQVLLSLVAPNAGAGAGAGEGDVSVLYAGSLVSLMEQDVGPAFNLATGTKFLGEGKGSVALANMIKDKLRTPDVFISADPKVNELLAGADNGNVVRWYATLFRNEMVLAYNPKSRFAAEFKEVSTNAPLLYDILQRKELRLGRTDPRLDPKGYRTLFLFDLAEKYYRQPGLTKKILGDAENPTQTFPEEQLAARLETGQLDAGIFYRNEAAEHHFPFITFPRELNLSDPGLDAYYGSTTYVSPKGKTYQGGAIVYTVTIPETARNREGAIALIDFLLSADGRKILDKHGLQPIQPTVFGDKSAVPAKLQKVMKTNSNQ